MSFSVTTDIHCDRCGSWTEGLTAQTTRVGQARAIARKRGWRCDTDGDICAECQQDRNSTCFSSRTQVG